MFSPLVQSLVDALRCLPGVGAKSAQRMALHLLERDREGALTLASTLQEAMEKVGHCEQCRTITEERLCDICRSEYRDGSQICVLETPADVFAVEGSGTYKGRYFVLMGHLSPIDGIGPEDIGIDLLLEQVKSGDVKEVILATNPTVEGEATAFYITEQLQDTGVKVSRIAHGVPLGGELEYVDGGTLAHAFAGRRAVEAND